ncbi:TPA: DUF721 domain-containing protein [Candidatus Saccharibacteria bacterium]|nr:DUF721 domain-containing protein [Candidatus Saccharibacteria bacterium]HIO87609.1 DUF721 domain-containing protein [Candidatus Saccharibacteria bacterium]
MDPISDLLLKKAKQLDFDSKKSELEIIQTELSRLHDTSVKLLKINTDRSILVTANSAAKATELRFQQVELLEIINSAVTKPITAVRIIIK